MQNFKIVLPSAFALFLACATHAYAELGGSVAGSMTRVQAHSSIVANQVTLNAFEKKLPSGTVVKEYSNAQGVVVAVAWQGPTMPDLKQLLGTHFDEMAQHPPATLGNHRSAEIRTDDLVVQSHGQMRAFAGRAYLPKLLPADFNLDQIN